MRTVLITGAARNIGANLAQRFAAAGYQVVVNATRPGEIEKVAMAINDDGGSAMAVSCDIRDQSQVWRMVEQVESKFGGVDVLVNNAMVRKQGPFTEITIEDWQEVLNVVLTGSFNCTRAVLPHMRRSRWGRVICMGGVAGERGAVDRAAVVTAKSGLFGFAKAVALETAEQGITANVVSPGIIDTDRGDLKRIGDEALVRSHYQAEIASIPVGRPGRLDEISAMCLFLASDDAAFITGQVIGVNGGRHM